MGGQFFPSFSRSLLPNGEKVSVLIQRNRPVGGFKSAEDPSVFLSATKYTVGLLDLLFLSSVIFLTVAKAPTTEDRPTDAEKGQC